MGDSKSGSSFWSSLPGVLTAVAALVTAVTGAWVAMGHRSDSGPALPAAGGGAAIAAISGHPKRVVVMGPLEEGVNRQGMDFSAVAPSAANRELCAEMCRINEQCRSMTYVISQKTCWLKSGVPEPKPPGGPDYVSAVKRL